MKLSKGDMRRALNILQACHAAYDQTGETEVYNCTGSPEPADIETVVNSMITDEFTTSYHSTSATALRLPGHIVLRVDCVLGLLTMFRLVSYSDQRVEDRTRSRTAGPTDRCLRIHRRHRLPSSCENISTRSSSDDRVCHPLCFTYPLLILISRLCCDGGGRHRLSTGGSEKIQLTALLGAFKNAVELTEKAKAAES